VYFNSLVDDSQGHTHFPLLNLSIVPKAGRAALWPNVYENGALNTWMIHEARPVISKGMQKFSMNLWITGMDQSKSQCATQGTVFNPVVQTWEEGTEQRRWQNCFRNDSN
jgi:hypothetical protein